MIEETGVPAVFVDLVAPDLAAAENAIDRAVSGR